MKITHPSVEAQAAVTHWLRRLNALLLCLFSLLIGATAWIYLRDFPASQIPFSEAKIERAICKYLTGNDDRNPKLKEIIPHLDRLRNAVSAHALDSAAPKAVVDSSAAEIIQNWADIVAIVGWTRKQMDTRQKIADTAQGGNPWKPLFFADLLYGKIDITDFPFHKTDKAPALYPVFQLDTGSFLYLSSPRRLRNDLVAIHVYIGNILRSAEFPIESKLYTIVLYFPFQDTFLHIVNLVFLFFVSWALMWLLRRRWLNAIALLEGGVLNIIAHYLMFLVPSAILLLGGVHNSLASAAWMRLAVYLLFDGPLFILSGICMASRDGRGDTKLGKFWVVAIVAFVLNYLANLPGFLSQAASLSGSARDCLALPNKWAELLPYAYSFVSLIVVAWGVRSRSRAHVHEGIEPLPVAMGYVAWIVPFLLIYWGGSQLLYPWQEYAPFFLIVFAAKTLALSGFLFFCYLQELTISFSEWETERQKAAEERERERQRAHEEQDRARQEAQIEIVKRSLEIIVGFDKDQRIQLCSDRAADLLGVTVSSTLLRDIIADEKDYTWLVSRLITPQKQWVGFELRLMDNKKQRLNCQADFVPKSVGHDYDMLIAQPLDSVLMAALGRRFHIHSMQGNINTCRTWLQQLVDDLKDYHAVVPEALPGVPGLRENLDLLSRQIGPESDLSVELYEPAFADLNRVLKEINATAEGGKRWPGLQVNAPIPEASVFVRAKERILTEIIQEFLDNAIKKGEKPDTQKASRADVRVTSDQELLTIVVTDDGSPIPQDELERLEHEAHAVMPGERLSLRRIGFYVKLFGGEFHAENREVVADGATVARPTFTLNLWRAE